MKTLVTILLSIWFISANAQNVEIGQWKDYLPYNKAIALETVDDIVYVATENSLFYLNTSTNSLSRLNKVNGLTDVGISTMKKEPNSETLVVAYKSTVIDLIKKNGSIHTVLDIERENIIGEKAINNISFHEQYAYLSCSFGIIQLNIEREEISNTYYFGNNLSVNDVSIDENFIYAATSNGIYKARLTDNLLDFNNWALVTADINVNDVEYVYQNLYFTTVNSTNIYSLTDTIEIVDSVENLRFIKSENERLFVGARSKLWEINASNNISLIKEHSFLYVITDIITGSDGTYWAADSYRALVQLSNNNVVRHFLPQGPNSNLAYSVTSKDNEVFLSPGGVSIIWNNNNTYEGFYWSDGYEWRHIPYTQLAGARDITTIIKSTNGDLFVGTWNNGVLQLTYDQSIENYTLIKEHNHLTTENGLQTFDYDSSSATYGRIRIKDLVFDDNGYLWTANSLTEKSLAFMTPKGEWQSLKVNSSNISSNHLGDLIIDDNGVKWFIISKGGGIVVYDDNNTPENASDDRDKKLSTSAGNGGLPSNQVFSLALDRDGEVWVGTDKGVAVFYNPENIFDVNEDAQQVLVEAEGYIEPIIANESVTTIAIDGANRKWFGTKSSGVFVYSADGSEQIHHFTTENSPLFSNYINTISINQNSGEVFIATDKGLISYKGGATEGKSQHTQVMVYPNPIRENYFGPIAIKNVVENADVKITDIKGNLIKTFTALGGQAVWDGKNQFGERPSTGVYLVFTTNPSGTETNVAKIAFIR